MSAVYTGEVPVGLDLMVLVFLLACAAWGALRGLLLQAISLGAFAAGLAAAWLVSLLCARVSPGNALSDPAVAALAGTAVFLLVSVLAVRIGRSAMKDRLLSFGGGAGDRVLGGLCGLAKGLVLVLLLVWILDAAAGDALRARRRAGQLWNGSRIVNAARSRNPLAATASLRRLRGFFTALRDPASRAALEPQAPYASLVSNPRYLAVRDDPSLGKAIGAGDFLHVLGDPRVRDIARDVGFRRDFLAVRWEAALETPAPSSAAAPRKEPTPPLPLETRFVYRTPEVGPPAVGEAFTPAALLRAAPPPPAGMIIRAPAAPPGGPPARSERVSPPPPVPAEGRFAEVRLVNGSVFRGRLVEETVGGVTMEIVMDGGVMRMGFSRAELERLDVRPAAAPATGEGN